jgi:spore germination protein Q
MSENQHDSKQRVNQEYPSGYPAQPYYYYPQTSPAFYPMYQTNQFPQQFAPPQQGQQSFPAQGTQGMGTQGQMPLQQSYIENILRLNRGKLATVYMTFEGSNAKTFKGIIEAAGRDHIILSDPQTGKRYLLLMVYLDYITFDEEINYSYPFDSGGPMATFPPRSKS